MLGDLLNTSDWSMCFAWYVCVHVTGSNGTDLLLFVYQLRGHDDEVLDVCFDFTGQYIATASADGKQIYSGDVQSLKYYLLWGL